MYVLRYIFRHLTFTEYKIPAEYASGELLYFEHYGLHMGDLLTCDDGWHLRLYCNILRTHQSLGILHIAILDQLQYRYCRYCMW